MENVVLLKCGEYNLELIENKIREGFELLGGEEYIRKVIPYNTKVLLKPNLLSIDSPGSIAVTNNVFFEAVIRVIKDYADDITFGDSPGFGDSKRAAEKAGLLEAANKYGVKFDGFKEAVHVKLDDAILCKSWDIAKAAYETDVLITLPRLKTHAMAFFTGAVKNQFGCVPGTLKATWHTRMSELQNFCSMLLDLNKVVGTSFAIMDSIVAMEGNGPRNGTPHELDAILMGESITAVDSVAARLIGYDNPIDTPILKTAYEKNWGIVLPEEIKVLGESIEGMKAKNFKLCRKSDNFNFINPTVMGLLRNAIAPNPYLISEKCIGCKRCYEVCPEKPKVIKMNKKGEKYFPVWDMSKCIRCFCCQELCPQGAIETKYPFVGRIINNKKR